MTGDLSVASSMRVWIVAAFARATSTPCVAVFKLASASARLARVVSRFVERTSRSRCEPAPSWTSLRERSASTAARFDLALLLDDGRLGDGKPLRGRIDTRVGRGELRIERDGVELHEDLARLHERAFVDQDLLYPQRFLRGDVDERALDPTVARDDALRKGRLPALPVPKADEQRQGDGRRGEAPRERALRDFPRHG